jgi:hypothetical protein
MRIVASAQDGGPNYSCDCFCTAEEHLSASSFHEFLHGLFTDKTGNHCNALPETLERNNTLGEMNLNDSSIN